MNRLTSILMLLMTAALPAMSPAADLLRFDSFGPGQTEFGITAAYGENHKIPESTKDRIVFGLVKFRAGTFVSPRTEFAGELSLGRQHTAPENRGWTAAGGIRYYLVQRGSTAVACDFSIGVSKFERRLTSQSTRTNFTEQLGLAVQHSIGPRSALTLEYKFSHTSNGGVKLPNLGINASIISLGYSWYP